ncbi:UNVERIFIED_CONTAM: hypothetical protein HDU68_011653 [Siphonaria sp. JEL0065]|nr:hypothetical protein HDU68_011653 [Siphonaria sp. JEL0065]
MLHSAEVRERKDLITKRTSFTFANNTHTIEASAMEWIFGDFFLVKHPKKKVLSVVKASNLAVSFMQLLPKQVHLTASRLDWFCDLSEQEKQTKNLLHELSKDIRNAKDFLEDVFGNTVIWTRVVVFCSSVEDVFDLVTATGSAVKESDEEIEAMKLSADEEVFKKWIVYGYRKIWKFNNPIVQNIPFETEILALVQEPIFAPLYENLKKHPSYLQSPRQWTNVLFEFQVSSKKSTVGRRCDLRDALAQQGLTLRNDSTFCNQFIAGTVCAELAQVVAICKLTSTLFAYGHSTWSHFREEKEKILLEMVLDQGKGWLEAANELVSSHAFITQCVKWASYVPKKRSVKKNDRPDHRQRRLVE